MFFAVFMALFVIFLNFLRWNLPKFSHHIASSGIRILILLTVCKILRKFTEGNSRKFTVSFAFCALADYLNFRPQRACDRKTLGSHLKWCQWPTQTKYGYFFSIVGFTRNSRPFATGAVCTKSNTRFWKSRMGSSEDSFTRSRTSRLCIPLDAGYMEKGKSGIIVMWS